MKITCLQEDLSAGLGLVAKAIHPQSLESITAKDVLIENDGGRLKLTCADNQKTGITIVAWIDAKIEGDQSVCLPMRLLRDLVGNLPRNSDIRVEVLDQPMGAKVTHGAVESVIYGHDPDDFNRLDIPDGREAAFFPYKDLSDALQRVLPAVATKDDRPILTGVKMELKESKFTLAAADGYRLAIETRELKRPSPKSVDVVLPGKSMEELRGLIEASKPNDVELVTSEDQNQLVFKMGDVQMTTLQMQGSFPDYLKLVPNADECKTKISVQLSELRNAVKISNKFVEENNRIIRFVTEKREDGEGHYGILTVKAKSEDTGENEIELEATIEGEEIKCAFDCRFLTALVDALKVGVSEESLRSERAVFTTQSASSAGLFKGTSLNEYNHVIMPMFVQW